MLCPDRLPSVLGFGGLERGSAVIGRTFRRVQPPRHRELLHGAIERPAGELATDPALSVGLDITRNDYPYGIIACPGVDALTPSPDVSSL